MNQTTAKPLPFDERNQRDFEELTARIQHSLNLIRKNHHLKATQETLAEVAHCSRRTLSLRVWPILELKRIKDSRSNHIKAGESKAESPSSVGTDTRLIGQVKNYQIQNGKLFEQVQGLKEEKARMAVVIDTLEDQLRVAKKKLEAMEKESRRSTLRAV